MLIGLFAFSLVIVLESCKDERVESQISQSTQLKLI